MHRYLTENDLPYHPLWDQGYVSIGDTHTSRPAPCSRPDAPSRDPVLSEIKRECGIHEQPRRTDHLTQPPTMSHLDELESQSIYLKLR